MRLLLCLALLGCSGAPEHTEPAAAPTAPPAAPAPAARDQVLGEVLFRGMCDASGAVSLSPTRMIAADDEDNRLRVYDTEVGGAPLSLADISAELGLPLEGKKNPKHPEMDLEAATLLGDRAYWLTSHGRNKKGKLETERLMFFATTVAADGAAIDVIGQGYDGLLQDLVDDPRYAGFDLAAAAELAPKDPGGLNIEGMTASTEDDLLIAFRNPVPGGRALIARLLNPAELVGPGTTAKARFGEPVQLDLGGQGIRGLSWWRGRYLLIAGDIAEGPGSRLYTWDGHAAPALVDVDLAAHNPEGFFSPEDRDEIMLLSDDGTVPVDGVPCKELDDPELRRFRGLWVRLAS